MEFDAGIGIEGAFLVGEAREGQRVHFRVGADDAFGGLFGFEGLVAAGEGGVHVVGRIFAEFVGTGVAQGELDAIAFGVGDGDGLFGEGDARAEGMLANVAAALFRRRGIGHEDVAPADDGAGVDAAHVEN